MNSLECFRPLCMIDIFYEHFLAGRNQDYQDLLTLSYTHYRVTHFQDAQSIFSRPHIEIQHLRTFLKCSIKTYPSRAVLLLCKAVYAVYLFGKYTRLMFSLSNL